MYWNVTPLSLVFTVITITDRKNKKSIDYSYNFLWNLLFSISTDLNFWIGKKCSKLNRCSWWNIDYFLSLITLIFFFPTVIFEIELITFNWFCHYLLIEWICIKARKGYNSSMNQNCFFNDFIQTQKMGCFLRRQINDTISEFFRKFYIQFVNLNT